MRIYKDSETRYIVTVKGYDCIFTSYEEAKAYIKKMEQNKTLQKEAA